MPGTLDREEPPIRNLARGGDRNHLLARQVRTGQALPRARHVVDRPLGDHLAALDSGARPEIDEVVGRSHGVFIVLDHDNGVALPGQPAQGCQQPVIIARVQPDRRLVQNVKDPDQPRTHLTGEPDSLRLAAGERRSGPIEGQVMQSDVDQERQPRTDLLQ